MKKSGDWMARIDDRLLEYVLEHGWASSGMIVDHPHIRVSPQYVTTRLGELEDHGLLEHMKNGVYHITREGQWYLAGGYDAEAGEYLDGADPDIDLPTHAHIGEWAAENCPMG